jgi:hypothetical protein
MMRMFDCFVGIDWSGARGPYQAGLAVFMAEAGDSAPMRIIPPNQKRWSRHEIASWLQEISATRRVLAGIDFAFSYPVYDMEGAYCGYFPEFADSPQDAAALWQLIEEINQAEAYLYGGAIWDHPDLGAYYNAPSGRRGAKFYSRRRQTEQAAKAVKSPSPTFNCVGPAGVGTGSLAGMRLLHHLADKAEIWPFDNQPAGSKNLTLVEIFPSYYFALAGIRAVRGNHGKLDVLNKALAYFGAKGLPAEFSAGGPDFDEADAAISAAALRALAAEPAIWKPFGAAAREGWIFGVK